MLPWAQRDLGPRSPGRALPAPCAARTTRVIDELIDEALADPALEERADVLALLLRANYDDGSSMSRSAIADQLLTLLAAGHETTATSLAWAVERLRRHPDDPRAACARRRRATATRLRIATIHEVQRTRPVIVATGRKVAAEPFELGEWRAPARARGSSSRPR